MGRKFRTKCCKKIRKLFYIHFHNPVIIGRLDRTEFPTRLAVKVQAATEILITPIAKRMSHHHFLLPLVRAVRTTTSVRIVTVQIKVVSCIVTPPYPYSNRIPCWPFSIPRYTPGIRPARLNTSRSRRLHSVHRRGRRRQ